MGTERRAIGGLQGVASSGKAEARVKKSVKWANAQAGATTAAAAKTKPTSAAAAAARVDGLLLGLCSCGGCGVYSGGSDEDGGNIGGRGNANKFNAASERAANETPERKINARTDGVTDD